MKSQLLVKGGDVARSGASTSPRSTAPIVHAWKVVGSDALPLPSARGKGYGGEIFRANSSPHYSSDPGDPAMVRRRESRAWRQTAHAGDSLTSNGDLRWLQPLMKVIPLGLGSSRRALSNHVPICKF